MRKLYSIIDSHSIAIPGRFVTSRDNPNANYGIIGGYRDGGVIRYAICNTLLKKAGVNPRKNMGVLEMQKAAREVEKYLREKFPD